MSLPPAAALRIVNTRLYDGNDEIPDAQISIVLNNKKTVLTVGDCIQYNRVGKDGEVKSTTAQILGFGSSNTDKYHTAILSSPWLEDKGRWGGPFERIGLEDPYLDGKFGDWTTIKLIKCPDGSRGGKRKNRKSTKKANRNRRRSTRRN